MGHCFENNDSRRQQSEAQPEVGNNLDSVSVCQGHPSEFTTRDNSERGSFGDGRHLELLASNDAIVANALRSLNSIQEKYDSLPPEYKSMVIGSFAQHMTGENYPAYDYLRHMA